MKQFTTGDFVTHEAHGLGYISHDYQNGEFEVYFSRDEFKWVLITSELTPASSLHLLLVSSLGADLVSTLSL